MKKSIIAFGILLSVAFNTVHANVNPNDRNSRSITSHTKNVAPLSLAVVQNDYQTVQRFLELGSDIEAKDKVLGMTPFMYAARYNHVELLKLLVAKGAQIDEISKLRYTALDYAKASNATEAISFLEAL